MIRILFLGDVFGRPGRQIVRDLLPGLVARREIDLVLANGENASGGRGLDRETAEELFDYGLALLTGGNHTFRFKEFEAALDRDPRLVRPANLPEPCPGRGWSLIQTAGGVRVGVGNLMGRVFLNSSLDCPFRTADRIIEEMKAAQARITIIDFHAEATSEKRALAAYLDGRLGALVGTHTHVPTADAALMPQGLAYITDLGLCGPHHSVIGMRSAEVLESFLSGRPARFEPARKGVRLQGLLLDFDESGRAQNLEFVDLSGPQ